MESQPKLELPPPFEEAMRRHEREIMRFILRATHDREEALDLFQETWLRAYRAYPQLDSANGLRPWLFRIASNLCLNRRRDRARHARVIEAGDGNEQTAADPASGGHDAVMHLRALIERLPSRQREVLMMRKFGGLEYDEIATALGCSCESARAGVYLALKKLKAAL
ncbi:MAG: RNA polymerase sigma factor [Candidatus Binataceae bacterium]